MGTIHGIGVTPGRVIGPVRRMPEPIDSPAEPAPGTTTGPDYVQEQSERLKEAGQAVAATLRARAENATPEGAEVLSATALMATDSMLHKSAAKELAAEHGVEQAIWKAAETVATMLTSMGGYMAQRATDVYDVRARIIAELRGVPAPGIPYTETPFILFARDLAPADTATLDPSRVLALVTSEGGPQSHTAILARSLGIPAVVAATGSDAVSDGTEVFIDGAEGTVVEAPGETERTAAQTFAEREPLPVFDGHGMTADGDAVPLLANVGDGPDAKAAADAGAEGVGLLRTEFCFLGRDTEPGHDEQVSAYGAVFAEFGGKKVVVRTLDAGADKPLPFLTDTSEPNPALGVRGYRTDASTPGVLARQLAAIAEAATAHMAEVWVMAPMIATTSEAAAFAAMCKTAGLPTAGVMVEVPSAALRAGSVLRPVSFASIGTNDLTQYAMAADRQLAPLATLNDPWQPAVLELIRLTTQGALSAGLNGETGVAVDEATSGTAAVSDAANNARPVGVCGEAAADPALAVVLVGLGVTSLSMTARALAPVAAVLRTVTLRQAQQLAVAALAADGPDEARTAARLALPILDELGL